MNRDESTEMYTDYLTVEAPTYEKCREIIHRRHGRDCKIQHHETFYKTYLGGLFCKELVRAYYSTEMEPPEKPYNDRVRDRGMNQAPVQPDGYSLLRTKTNFDESKSDLLKNLAGNIDSVKQLGKVNDRLDAMEKILSTIKRMSSAEPVHPSIKKIDAMLEKNEFTPSFIEEINVRIGNELTVGELDDFDLVQESVVDWIGESIKVAPHYPKKSSSMSHTIIIIGPTGVGKTTTVAKMAATIIRKARKAKGEHPKIVMITTDKERIAAKEQLEHYAAVMEAEFFVASTPEDFEELYNYYKSKSDFIFVDTSGYSPRDLESIGKLHSLLDVDGMKADIYLAVSAMTKSSDLENILRNYDSFNYRTVIVTKCDETVSYGNVLSVLAEKKKQVSLVSFGQKTLNNMRIAHPYFFLKGLTDFVVDKDHIMEKFGPDEGLGEG